MRDAHFQTDVTSPLRNEDGVAMLTILMLTVILTVIGIAAITTTSQDLKVTGGEKLRVTGVNAAEACMSSAVQIIQQTLQNSVVPTTLLGAGANPFIATNAAGLGTGAGQNPIQAEIMGQSDKNPDTADFNAPGVAPNAVLTLTGYSVNMDIDRLYAKPKAGGSLQFAAGYEGMAAGAAGGGIEIIYRIDCYAQNTSGAMQVNSRITGVYSCVATGQSCQRKI